MKTPRVTEQRFNTIKRQLRVRTNDRESIASAHGLKVSTVVVIDRCKDFATYSRRRGSKALATAPEHSILDSNLTPEQAQAYLDMATNLQLANDTIKRLEGTVRQKDGLITSLRTELADCNRRLTATIIESARRKRTLWARIRRTV